MSENVFDKAKISDEEWSRLQISRLSSRPNAKTAYGSGGYDAKAMKEGFDAQGNLLKERHNLLIDYARDEEGARAAAESARNTAETARNNAENGYYDEDGEFVPGRVQNEIQRQEYYKDIGEFTEIIANMQEGIIGGGVKPIISLLDVYPVGSIYISINNVNPERMFGGTWEQIKDRFLLSAGDTYTAGETGGSADAVVVSHRHYMFGQGTDTLTEMTVKNGTADKTVAGYFSKSGVENNMFYEMSAANDTPWRGLTSIEGESGTGKNMPPYLAVYMWQRTA